jgi:hypothetical protein
MQSINPFASFLFIDAGVGGHWAVCAITFQLNTAETIRISAKIIHNVTISLAWPELYILGSYF